MRHVSGVLSLWVRLGHFGGHFRVPGVNFGVKRGFWSLSLSTGHMCPVGLIRVVGAVYRGPSRVGSLGMSGRRLIGSLRGLESPRSL